MHELKIWPEFFEAVISGRKTFEVRKNDRFFCFGDTVVLREFVPDKVPYFNGSIKYEGPKYTGRQAAFMVGYIFHLDGDFVVFSLLPAGDEACQTPG